MWKSYADLLKDPRWKQKRLEIINRDENKCTECQSEEILQAHHRYYFKGLKPWEYENSALETLCKACHKKAEDSLELFAAQFRHTFTPKQLGQMAVMLHYGVSEWKIPKTAIFYAFIELIRDGELVRTLFERHLDTLKDDEEKEHLRFLAWVDITVDEFLKNKGSEERSQ